jgi:hypothetical protein
MLPLIFCIHEILSAPSDLLATQGLCTQTRLNSSGVTPTASAFDDDSDRTLPDDCSEYGISSRPA